jgi:hypothetical protein
MIIIMMMMMSLVAMMGMMMMGMLMIMIAIAMMMMTVIITMKTLVMKLIKTYCSLLLVYEHISLHVILLSTKIFYMMLLYIHNNLFSVPLIFFGLTLASASLLNCKYKIFNKCATQLMISSFLILNKYILSWSELLLYLYT